MCVRHHAIDWNFVGKPRSRPNKWRIEMREDRNVWKEWAFAKDEHGQHIYMERWERLAGDGGARVALRLAEGPTGVGDAFVVVIGDHFNFIRNRGTQQPRIPSMANEPGLTGLIDRLAADDGSDADRALAEEYLGLRAGHGRSTAAP